MLIRIFYVVNSQGWQVRSKMIGEKVMYHCRLVWVEHEERMGEGEATLQKGVTVCAERQRLLQKGRQALGNSHVIEGKKSVLRGLCG